MKQESIEYQRIEKTENSLKKYTCMGLHRLYFKFGSRPEFAKFSWLVGPRPICQFHAIKSEAQTGKEMEINWNHPLNST